MRELESKGHLKERGQPLDRSGKVVRGSKRTVTDGPFVEVKDMVAGFIVVRARRRRSSGTCGRMPDARGRWFRRDPPHSSAVGRDSMIWP